MKPHLKIVAGRPVTVPHAESPAMAKARERFGRKFAHEPGSDWQEHPERVLTRWTKHEPWQNVKAQA